MTVPKGEITSVKIGMPGPPGVGVSAAEKATFVTTTGSPVFTTPVTITSTNAAALLVEDAVGSDVMRVNTSTDVVGIANGYDLILYSDAYSTAKATIDGATGNTTLSGTLTTTRIIGETTILPIVIDGGGVAITSGVKVDLPIPYNGTITRWEIGADVSGSIAITLTTGAFGSWPPAGALLTPSMTTNTTAFATGLSSSITQGNYIRVNVTSATSVTRVVLALYVTKA